MDTYGTLHGFVEDIEERASSRIENFDHGRALFNDTFPLVWDMNFARVEREPETWDQLRSEVDEVQGEAGLSHRKMSLRESPWVEPLLHEARGHGWDATSLVYMVRTSQGEKQNQGRAREVTYDEVRPLRWELSMRQPWAKSETDVRQVLDGMHSWMSLVDARHVGVEVEGKLVAAADVYRGPGVAQIEDVETMSEHQGRGYATDIVLEATDIALRAQPDATIFLVADENDWPRKLYERLGFEVIGRTFTILKPPQ